MTYYTLLSRANKTSRWAIEFGDKDRECVQSELEDHVDHDVKKSNLKIISTKSMRQSEIDAKVSVLNSGVDLRKSSREIEIMSHAATSKKWIWDCKGEELITYACDYGMALGKAKAMLHANENATNLKLISMEG